MAMNTLSRREEDTLMKTTKAYALKECDPIVKEFAECATGRTVTVAWACKDHYKRLQDCMYQYTNPDSMQLAREEYLRIRNQQQASQTPS